MFKKRKIELRLVKDDSLVEASPRLPIITEKEHALTRDLAKQLMVGVGVTVVACVALNVLGAVATHYLSIDHTEE